MPGAGADTPGLVSLGRSLYFERRLSVNGTQSCNDCHRLDGDRPSGADGHRTSDGARGDRGKRNAPSVKNAGYHVAQFWDGRAKTLEEQAEGPILNSVEMGMPSAAAAEAALRAAPEYREPVRRRVPGRSRAGHPAERGPGPRGVREDASDEGPPRRFPQGGPRRPVEPGGGGPPPLPEDGLHHLPQLAHDRSEPVPAPRPRQALGHRRRGPLRRHEERGGPAQVQGAVPPQRGEHRPLLPRRLGRPARRGRPEDGLAPARQGADRRRDRLDRRLPGSARRPERARRPPAR